MARNLGNSIASGAAWMVLFRVFERSIGIVSTLILARLLLPEDFGVIAMAMSIVAILEILWSFSFDAALIQQREATKTHFDSAWTLNVILGMTMAVGLLMLAYPAAAFYEDHRLVPLIACLAAGSVFQGFENIGVVLFRKEMRFGAEFAYQLGRKVAGFIVTIPLAIIFRNYWALAAGMITSRLAGMILSYFAHPFRPGFSFAEWRSIVGFSKWLFLNSALFALQTRTQDFVIGKLQGPAGLGLYNVSHEISTMATTEVVFPINRAVFPGFAKMAEHEPDALLTGYVRVFSIVALLVLPLGLGISVTAEWLIPVALGSNWHAAIPVVQILGAYGAFASLGSVFGPTLMAIGRSKILSVLSAINVALFIPVVVYGAMTFGIIGAAWGSLAVVAIMLPFSHWFVARIIGVSTLEVWRNIQRPLFAALLMFVVVRHFVVSRMAVNEFSEMITNLASAVCLGAIVYCSAVWLLWLLSGKPDGGERMAIDAVVGKLSRRTNTEKQSKQ